MSKLQPTNLTYERTTFLATFNKMSSCFVSITIFIDQITTITVIVPVTVIVTVIVSIIVIVAAIVNVITARYRCKKEVTWKPVARLILSAAPLLLPQPSLKPDIYSTLLHEKGSKHLKFGPPKHCYFFLPGIQGYLKHSSNKCVGVKAGKLVFQASCTSGEQVFYKESFSSPLVHIASGKCVADPGSDGTVGYDVMQRLLLV